jgi:hypothetical protein
VLAGDSLLEAQARGVAVMLTLLVQAKLLLDSATDAASSTSPTTAGAGDAGAARAVAEGFCNTRLKPESGWGTVFGASTAAANLLDERAILERATPFQ